MTKTLTEEDYARIRAEARRVRDKALGLVDDEQKTIKKVESGRGSSRKGIVMPARPQYSREKIAQLHKDGMAAPDIAEIVGCHRGTVHRILKELGYGPKNGKSGQLRKTHCMRNHDLSVYGQELERGGRQCMECKRERNREWWRKNRGVSND